jgi:hypothetical protein
MIVNLLKEVQLVEVVKWVNVENLDKAFKLVKVV